MLLNLPAFIITTFLLAMLPGVGQALIMRQTLTHGYVAAWKSVAGTAFGVILWSTLAAAGLSALLLANPAVYVGIRVAGGIVLLVMGASSLRTMLQHRSGNAPVSKEPRSAFLAGLATNLGNPKAGVFAVSFVPQFIAPNGPVLLSGMVLGVIWACSLSVWYAIFVFSVHHGRSMVTKPRVVTWLHGITGVVLVLLGISVIFGLL